MAAGARAVAADEGGWSPLHHAARNGNFSDVKALLAAGARADQADQNGFTPLHCAVIGGHAAIVNLLLEQGADPNAVTRWGGTPLYFSGKPPATLDIAEALLKAGANPTLGDQEGKTSLTLAVEWYSRRDIAEASLKAGAGIGFSFHKGNISPYALIIYNLITSHQDAEGKAPPVVLLIGAKGWPATWKTDNEEKIRRNVITTVAQLRENLHRCTPAQVFRWLWTVDDILARRVAFAAPAAAAQEGDGSVVAAGEADIETLIALRNILERQLCRLKLQYHAARAVARDFHARGGQNLESPVPKIVLPLIVTCGSLFGPFARSFSSTNQAAIAAAKANGEQGAQTGAVTGGAATVGTNPDAVVGGGGGGGGGASASADGASPGLAAAAAFPTFKR